MIGMIKFKIRQRGWDQIDKNEKLNGRFDPL